MREMASICAMAYDHNCYNKQCRGNEIFEQDLYYILEGYERMVFNSIKYVDNSQYTPRILDLGCGCGLPYTKELDRLGRVLGCDVSEQQVISAGVYIPTARFIRKDVMDLHLCRKYDMVTMFNSFFNISFADKPVLLARINYWLKPYGVALITTYGDVTEVREKEDFYGMPMKWHHISVHDFEKLAIQAGFCIVSHESREDSIGSKETHLWTLEKA